MFPLFLNFLFRNCFVKIQAVLFYSQFWVSFFIVWWLYKKNVYKNIYLNYYIYFFFYDIFCRIRIRPKRFGSDRIRNRNTAAGRRQGTRNGPGFDPAKSDRGVQGGRRRTVNKKI